MRKIIYCLMLTSGLSAWCTANVGQPAPDFTLMGSDGITHHLGDYKGKSIVVLEWFNPGCPYVHKHYDSGNMQALQGKYSGKDVAWFTIDSSVKGKQGHLEPGDLKPMHDEKHMANTALVADDAKSSTAINYDAKTTPHMFIIGKDGRIAYNGAIDSDDSAHAIKLADYQKDPKIQRYFENALIAVQAGHEANPDSHEPYGCSVKY